MKRIWKKALICIIIITVLATLIPQRTFAGESFLEKLGSGLIGVFTWILRAPFMGIVKGLNAIVTSLVKIGASDIASYEGAAGADDFFVTPFHIFFNKITILDVNFLDLNVTGTVLTFRTAVAGWYYTIRLISCMILAVILIYIGIRMAISTIASEKAMYKKMIVDWATSLALLFLLHYIMIFTFACNDAIINALETAASQVVVYEEDGDPGKTMSTFMDNLEAIAMDFTPESLVLSFAAIGVYGIVVIQTLGFILAYIKRMLTIGFLIIIAPMITITYSIDKIGDGKAQALNTWLKEFVYNILIQPFHCILFMSFAAVAMKLLAADTTAGDSSIATAVLAILCIQFVKTGEEIVKKIFGFNNASSLSSMAAGTAMAMTALAKSKDAGKAIGGAVSKGKNLIANNKEVKALKKNVGKAANTIKGAVGAKYAKHREKSTNEKIQRKAEREANKKHGGKATQEQIEAMRKQIISQNASKKTLKLQKKQEKKDKKANKEKFTAKHPIISSLGDVAKSAGAVPLGLAKDAGKYMKKNASSIIGAGVGATLGIAGLANGAAGFAVGYNAGSGIVHGYMSNTNRTLKDNMGGYAQAVGALEGITDTSAILYSTDVQGENDSFKDMKKEINNLLNALQKMGQTDKTANQIALGNMQKMLHTSPGSLDRERIKEIISGTMGEDAANDDKVIDAFASHMGYEARASLYKEMKTAKDTGRTVDDMVEVVGDIKINNTTSYDEIDVESAVDLDYKMLAQDITSIMKDSSQNLNDKQIDSLNADIQSLNVAINALNSGNESAKTQILTALKQSETISDGASLDDAVKQLQAAITSRETIIKNIQGPGNNT